MFSHLFKRAVQFLVAAYLFSKGYRSPYRICALVHVHHRHVFVWSLSPLWKPTVWLLGYRGEIVMKGLKKYKRKRQQHRLEIQRQHHNRMESLKKPLIRMSGQLRNDLMRAEKIWTNLFSKESTNDESNR